VALSYCEVCGVLIKGGGQDLPEGVICDECFASRQVEVPEESGVDEANPKEKIQFECPYCAAVLRVAVNRGKRTNIRCPKCTETFYAAPDGSVKARLEGNTTQVLVQDDLYDTLSTPSSGTEAGPDEQTSTRAMRAAKNATQPMRPMGHASTQPLRPLGGAKSSGAHQRPTAGFPPLRPGGSGQHDKPTGSFGQLGEAPAVLQPGGGGAGGGSGGLDLLPEEVSISDVRRKTATHMRQELRASDEGRIALDAGSLREKTERLKRGKLHEKMEEELPAAEPASRSTGKKPKPKAPKKSGRVSDRIKRKDSGKLDKSSGTIKREKRVATARQRADEIEAERSGRALRLGMGWILVTLPLLAALFFMRLGWREASLVAPEKPVGRALRAAGGQGDRAVRSLNELLPAGSRLPDLPPERPVSLPPGGVTPVTSRSAPKQE